MQTLMGPPTLQTILRRQQEVRRNMLSARGLSLGKVLDKSAPSLAGTDLLLPAHYGRAGMLFPPQIEELPSQTVALGGTLRFPITRNFALEGFVVTVVAVTSAATATIGPEGALGLLKNCRLSVNDGGASRDIVNSDGLWIDQRHGQYGGNLDSDTLTAQNAALGGTTTYTMRYIHFIPPFSVEDPTRSAFLANLPRYNADPVLALQFASQADLDTNATPTLAFSSITVYVTTFKRFVRTDKWRFIDTEFFTSSQDYPNNQANQRYNIPVPGYHFAIGARPYSSATALGDFTQTGGLAQIRVLNSFDRQLYPAELRALNQFSIPSDQSTTTQGIQRLTIGTVRWWDYLSDLNGAGALTLDGLYDTNPYASIGTGPQVVWDLNGGSGKKIVYAHDRCFGDISAFQYLPRLVGK